MKKLIFLILCFGLSFSSTAFAGKSPLGVSILPPLQFPPSSYEIYGIRASALWGHHRDMYGLDFALGGSITDQDFLGLAVAGLFNNTRGTTRILGLQAAGLANVNSQKTRILGLQITAGINYLKAESSVIGIQLGGLGNIAEASKIYGFQVGIYNSAMKVYGFQIGLINSCKSLHGIQIGLINFHHTGAVNMSPIINIGF